MFDHNVMTPVNLVLHELSYDADFMPGCTAELNRRPDFGLYTYGRNGRVPNAVGVPMWACMRVCLQVLRLVAMYLSAKGPSLPFPLPGDDVDSGRRGEACMVVTHRQYWVRLVVYH